MVAEESALVRREMTVIVPKTMGEMVDLAERIAKSSLLPLALQGKVPETLMQIMAGQELGMYPMASLRSFDFFEAKPRMNADGMVAVVLGSGKAEYFKRVGEGSATSVTYATKRRGQEEQRCTWTIEMAKAASLHLKDNWRGYPRAMLSSRAKSELARDVYPDVLAGCYTPDEINDGLLTPQQKSEAIEAEFIDVPMSAPPPEAAPLNPALPPLLAKIAQAATTEELKGYAAEFSALKLGRPGTREYDLVNDAYKERLKWIKAQPVPASPRTSSDGASGSGAPTANGSVTQSDASTGEATT